MCGLSSTQISRYIYLLFIYDMIISQQFKISTIFNNQNYSLIKQHHKQINKQMDEQQYQHESQCEDYVDYGPDGYHPVVLGQKFNHNFVVIQKLGWGHFSTVWLVQNQTTKEYAALKIQRSKQSHSQSAIDQMKILNEIRKHENDVKWVQQLSTMEKLHPVSINSKLCRPLLLYDNFLHYGIHGKHYCSVFQILGPNLLDLIQHYQFKDLRMPIWLVKKITIDVLLGLVYLHEHCDIIHTDLKPQNIMIKMETQQQQQFIENIKKYKIKPISMKYLKNLQASKNTKTKKKNEKKKLKKKLKKQGQKAGQAQNQEENEQKIQQSSVSVVQISSSQQKDKAVKQQKMVQQNEHKQKQVKNNDEKQNKHQHEHQHTVKQNTQTKNQQQNKQKINQQVDMKILKWKNVQIQLNNKLFFKIVDMGNACFATHHYTEDIQTRQYRSPQVILGYSYAHNTDIWSLACVIFQLLTNNFLFKPKPLQGISKDQDHLYKIIEVLGPMTKQFALEGPNSNQFFNKKGKLLHGHPKQHVRIHQLLHEDYGYGLEESVQMQQFLLPMLQIQDSKRISARDCLKNQWLWK